MKNEIDKQLDIYSVAFEYYLENESLPDDLADDLLGNYMKSVLDDPGNRHLCLNDSVWKELLLSSILDFFRIMLPLISSLIGAVFLLFFIAYWNDFETPYVFMNKPTLSIGLYATLNGWSVDSTGGGASLDDAQKSITGMMVFLPIFVVFIAFRNKIMGNLTEGGIKG